MRVARATAMVTRGAGNEEAMAMAARVMATATMVVGEQGDGNEEGDDDGDGDKGGRGWRATKRALATAARAMATAQQEAMQQLACAIRQREGGAVRR